MSRISSSKRQVESSKPYSAHTRDSNGYKVPSRPMEKYQRMNVPQQKVGGEARGAMKLRNARRQEADQTADGAPAHLEDAKEAASLNSATSPDIKALSAQADNALEAANTYSQKDPDLKKEIGPLLEKLDNSIQELAKDKTAIQGAGGNSGGAPVPGQIPGHTADPEGHVAHTRHRQDQLHEQQMAMQDTNMKQQLAINSMQQLHQTVTAFSQAATMNTAGLCNTILDCVKAINDLLKKGGNMQSSAISG